MTFAYEHNCEKLRSVALRLAAVHIVDLVKTDEFRCLSLEIVSQLLASDELAVSREEDVWDVVMQWIEYDEENRKSRFEELSRVVRFPLIAEREFVLSHPDRDLVSCRENDLPFECTIIVLTQCPRMNLACLASKEEHNKNSSHRTTRTNNIHTMTYIVHFRRLKGAWLFDFESSSSHLLAFFKKVMRAWLCNLKFPVGSFRRTFSLSSSETTPT